MLRAFLNQPVWVRVLRGIALALVMAAITVYVPTPYMLNAPGRAVPVSSILDIEDQRARPVDGQYLMTTVLSEKATLLMCIYSLIDPAASLSEDTMQNDGHRAQAPSGGGQMELAQFISTRVALEHLGYETKGTCMGLRVLALAPDSPNREALQPGDLLVALQGRDKIDLVAFRSLVEKTAPGEKLKARIKRGEETLEIEMGVVKVEGKGRVGAILRPEYTSVELPVKVNFHSGNTSGASGGLVFALEIYDRLDRKTNLARGRIIAATGTLDPAGQVGPIEGLKFKLVGAERAGADTFLVPRENFPEIQNVPTNMKIIPVTSFDEAVRALR